MHCASKLPSPIYTLKDKSVSVGQKQLSLEVLGKVKNILIILIVCCNAAGRITAVYNSNNLLGPSKQSLIIKS